jgi:hypothetical protein
MFILGAETKPNIAAVRQAAREADYLIAQYGHDSEYVLKAYACMFIFRIAQTIDEQSAIHALQLVGRCLVKPDKSKIRSVA